MMTSYREIHTYNTSIHKVLWFQQLNLYLKYLEILNLKSYQKKLLYRSADIIKKQRVNCNANLARPGDCQLKKRWEGWGCLISDFI